MKDPNEVMVDMVLAISSRDTTKFLELAQALAEWVDNGGEAPEDIHVRHGLA